MELSKLHTENLSQKELLYEMQVEKSLESHDRALMYSRNQGKEEGINIGIEKGREEGREEEKKILIGKLVQARITCS